MCQGKMPQSVRDRYMKMKAQPEHSANIDALIKNFDRAISHPEQAQKELAHELAKFHAEQALKNILKLPCSTEQKLELVDAVVKHLKEQA